MILVPLGTVTPLAVFPEEIRFIPLWFWVTWSPVSVWAMFDEPARIESVAPVTHVRESAIYANWAGILAIANLASSIAAVIYLGWWT